MSILEHLLWALVLATCVVVGGGVLLASALRNRGLRWTWALWGLPVSLLVAKLEGLLGLAAFLACVVACRQGAKCHQADIAAGADHAESAYERLGVIEALQSILEHERTSGEDRGGVVGDGGVGWVRRGWVEVGRDQRSRPVCIPVGFRSGSHALIVGATGSGKTVSEAWVACRLIEAGHGAVVIDPKGDGMLEEQLRRSAQGCGARFLQWSPDGPLSYNPYAHGSHTEIADKALAGEKFTEPHYLRRSQRYIANVVRAMQAAGILVTPASLALHMQPIELEAIARKLEGDLAEEMHAYLDSLGARGQHELSGVRDRLAILAESDAHEWLDPQAGHPVLDLHRAVCERAVVYFRLDADRRLLLGDQVARAVLIDLITLIAQLQHDPIPTVVLIDEFSAIAAEHVSRLFARARSAGVSVILATQELADLKSAGEHGVLREQVLGNIQTLLAHRQNVPESAELLASIAGTRHVWVKTQQTQDGVLGSAPSGRGTRRRGHEYEIHPSLIKRLSTGQALLVNPGHTQPPTIVQIHHPNEAQR